MENTKFCSNCGQKIAKDAQFCPFCGAKQAAPVDEPVQSSQQSREYGQRAVNQDNTEQVPSQPAVSQQPASSFQEPVQSQQQSQQFFQQSQQTAQGQPNEQPKYAQQNQWQQQQNQQSAVQPAGVNANGIINKTVNATKDMFQKYVEINGRTSVADFWYAYLGLFVLGMVVGLFTLLIPIVGIILSVALEIPLFTMTIRRMHDINRPGIQFLLFIIPLVGLVLMIMWCIQKGTDGVNAFGPKPIEVTK